MRFSMASYTHENARNAGAHRGTAQVSTLRMGRPPVAPPSCIAYGRGVWDTPGACGEPGRAATDTPALYRLLGINA